MNPNDRREHWRLLELCERAVDGRLTRAEQAELETALHDDATARQIFASALHQNAELRYDQRLLNDLTGEALVPVPAPSVFKKFRKLAVAAAACVAVGAVGFLLARGTSAAGSAKTIATVIKSTNSKWAGSTLPTAQGSRVAAGTLELLEGMATLKFDSGAEVIMEAPVTLELIDAMNCRLVRGTLVADVPPQAIGFAVDTPEAKVVDFGTRFGVSASEDGKYLVKVLEGLVEVNPKQEGKSRKLKGGEAVDTGLRKNQLNPQNAEQESHRWQPNLILDAGDGWQVISTAYSRGKDSYIQSSGTSKDFGTHPYLRVKHSGIVTNLDRKGYLGFDISRFDKKALEDAELVLTIEPSDLGFASLVPDSTFTVYGVTDETQDFWEENALTWHEAPAHDPKHLELNKPDLSKAAVLGQFKVSQGATGPRTLHCQALVDFLRADTNGLVTLIICRETPEMDRDGLVHAFATKESRNNTPPLLRLKLKKVQP